MPTTMQSWELMFNLGNGSYSDQQTIGASIPTSVNIISNLGGKTGQGCPSLTDARAWGSSCSRREEHETLLPFFLKTIGLGSRG